MSYNTYRNLRQIYDEYGSQEFGRICQALLELTFREIGFSTHGRATERPDISAERGIESYAIEVKAPDTPEVEITKRDLKGLKDYGCTGVIPILAILFFGLQPEWIIINAISMKSGKYNKIALRIHTIQSLSIEINTHFENILNRHYQLTLDRGSEGLRSRLY